MGNTTAHKESFFPDEKLKNLSTKKSKIFDPKCSQYNFD